MSLKDAFARQEALRTDCSFIVQAPAGSGKTGLITQRFLALLSIVEQPEDILAITFTRKAANEMQQRIIEALEAGHQPEPEAEHEKNTWRLAQKALARDQEKLWQIIDNPKRLRIQTIDSFCASVVKQMPLLARFGAQPGIEENAQALYLRAAESFIEYVLSLVDDSEEVEHLAVLLRYLDNRVDWLVSLVASMLARRDQWMRHFYTDQKLLNQDILEGALAQLVGAELGQLAQAAPMQLGYELFTLFQDIVDHYAEIEAEHPLVILAQDNRWPGEQDEELERWQALASFLLKQDGGVRRSFTAKQGIRAPSAVKKDKELSEKLKEQKSKLKELCLELENYPDFVSMLGQTLQLPHARYSDEQWQIIQSLNVCLSLAVAFLRVEFQQQGKVDFVELSQSAQHALSDEVGVTELAMKLDYKIQHILVDEFQDTSHGQYELLKLLTQGWTPDDGRTLFVVGDPMQSIYRFREADVGLYQKCWQQGLGEISLHTLNLTTNFRSQSQIVQWVNNTFEKVFPQHEDGMLGAVSVSHADFIEDKTGGDIHYEHVFNVDADFQSRRVVELVEQKRTADSEQSIAVLVRGKAHAQSIIRQLKDKSIPVHAVEMERLHERPMIQDLRNLTRIMINASDRLAWVGLLRSPFCGLSLPSIHQLVSLQPMSMLSAMVTLLADSALPADEMQRLENFYRRIHDKVDNADRHLLSDLVKSAWIALGGLSLNREPRDLLDAEQFFQVLQDWSGRGAINKVAQLDEMIASLFSQSDASVADNPVQIMSIHKSKGLEFDVVIIPHLEKMSQRDAAQLILWQELPETEYQHNFVVAPMKVHQPQQDNIYHLLDRIHRKKSFYENGRLLYVAATRAKKSLTLLAQSKATVKDDEVKVSKPPAGSLLEQLWPVVQTEVETLAQDFQEADEEISDTAVTEPRFRRMDTSIEPMLPESPLPEWWHRDTLASEEPDIEFDWASPNAPLLGSLIHYYLQLMAEQGLDQWSEEEIYRRKGHMRRYFVQAMVADEDIDALIAACCEALKRTLSDDQGRWILASYSEQACEQSLTIKENNQFATFVIDRTFVDESGVRWIIDYKTGRHQGGGLDQFIDDELERYRLQLKKYANIYRKLESRPIRCGLYFPFHGKLALYPESF
ncbi:exodeoxyribonuclease V subunit beta [Pleionea sp. CnH1-48]|uniref:UvrD-helicase domain-containing protein n=1 Tax=Pleionea sp. CnH1-48 TaxID=2954494 RepID=UPI0020984B1B|nr:UvrD-helicase domain-containing protein [Pleionea sp. CnH1-48]MCO7223911.1 UvrD-helicase domain-containing protein [Pleionea sp. CnH1-48]